jgi:hypothetical protein
MQGNIGYLIVIQSFYYSFNHKEYFINRFDSLGNIYTRFYTQSIGLKMSSKISLIRDKCW